jgi:hypothetical protein
MKTIHLTLRTDSDSVSPLITIGILVRNNPEQSFKNITQIYLTLQHKLLKSKTLELYLDVSLSGTFLSHYELKTVKRILQRRMENKL